jgi:hypothetical protein
MHCDAMSDITYHADVIRRLGGKAVLCRLLGIEQPVVSKWHVRGIPAFYWPNVERLAAQSSDTSDITALLLAEAKPQPRRAA